MMMLRPFEKEVDCAVLSGLSKLAAPLQNLLLLLRVVSCYIYLNNEPRLR